jgi:hypothetical protein
LGAGFLKTDYDGNRTARWWLSFLVRAGPLTARNEDAAGFSEKPNKTSIFVLDGPFTKRAAKIHYTIKIWTVK